MHTGYSINMHTVITGANLGGFPMAPETPKFLACSRNTRNDQLVTMGFTNNNYETKLTILCYEL